MGIIDPGALALDMWTLRLWSGMEEYLKQADCQQSIYMWIECKTGTYVYEPGLSVDYHSTNRS